MMIPNIWKKKHVSNHQPVIIGKPMVWGTNIPHFNVQKPPFSPAKGQRSHRGTRIERCLRPPSVGCSECPGQPIFGRGTSSSGGFNPSEKYESQLGLLFRIYGKITNVPNHQPAIELSNYRIVKSKCHVYCCV